mgnify:CR=1 FL=1
MNSTAKRVGAAAVAALFVAACGGSAASPSAPALTGEITLDLKEGDLLPETYFYSRDDTRDGLLLRMGEADFTNVIDANLTAAYRVTKRAAQGMLKARKGRIVLVSSVAGLLGSAGQANYAASKAGLVGLARSLARELGSRSITVNVVAPGLTQTDATAFLSQKEKDASAR